MLLPLHAVAEAIFLIAAVLSGLIPGMIGLAWPKAKLDYHMPLELGAMSLGCLNTALCIAVFMTPFHWPLNVVGLGVGVLSLVAGGFALAKWQNIRLIHLIISGELVVAIIQIEALLLYK